MVRSGDVGASELSVSASGVAEGVFTFVLVKLIGARRPGEVVEPRRAERGGGDVRSGGDAAAAGAANPLWAAVR